MIFNFVVTERGNPLFFEEYSDDGWGKFAERSWKSLRADCDLPLNVSDYVVEKYPVGFNVIYEVLDMWGKTIDKTTLKIQKAELVLLP